MRRRTVTGAIALLLTLTAAACAHLHVGGSGSVAVHVQHGSALCVTVDEMNPVIAGVRAYVKPLRTVQACVPEALLPTSAPLSAAGMPQPHGAAIAFPTVGKFSYHVARELPFNCTGTVISALDNNPAIVLVAAHCLLGDFGPVTYRTSSWSFAPGWHNSTSPYGRWDVAHAYYPSRWAFHCVVVHCDFNPRYDFAFLVLRQQNGHQIGAVTGSDGWQIGMPKAIKVTIAAIPGNSTGTLTNTTVSTTIDPGGYLAREASTPGFGNGASGGPWFFSYDAKLRVGSTLGDIGGYQDGGNSPSISYSPFWNSYFSAALLAVSRTE